MTYSVHQHWDPLRVCAVGKMYPAEFFNFITDSEVRDIMQRIASETEQDLLNLAKVLKSFDVEVIRTDLEENTDCYHIGTGYLPPPMTPRDDTAMIGTKFFMPTPDRNRKWDRLRGTSWPTRLPINDKEFCSLPKFVLEELTEIFNIDNVFQLYDRDFSTLTTIQNQVKQQGNTIYYDQQIDSAMVCRLGKDLYFGTWDTSQYNSEYLTKFQNLFPEYRCHIVNTEGHLDGTFCPVSEGLIISSRSIDPEVFDKLFPGWEVVYIDINTPPGIKKWWVPGEENNIAFTNFVNTSLKNWVGSIEETSIDVNFLIVNPTNILCTQENDVLFRALERFNIKAHVVPFRHSTFWDGGLHCFTTDLNRDGAIKDYFPERN
jgi:N-dimethylarginine dimethylaminohydrolase